MHAESNKRQWGTEMANAVDDFLKEAGFLSDLGRGLMGEGGKGFGHAVGQNLLGAGIAVGVGAASTGAYSAFKKIMDYRASPRDYQAMMSAHPSLKKKPARQVQMLYNSLRTTAPDMAKDPLIAGSFIRNMMAVQPDEGLAIPMDTVKTLADTQKGISDARSKDKAPDFFNPLLRPSIG